MKIIYLIIGVTNYGEYIVIQFDDGNEAVRERKRQNEVNSWLVSPIVKQLVVSL